MPPDGQNVIVTMVDGTELLAYWHGDQWWVGVENELNDAPLSSEVISWRWAE